MKPVAAPVLSPPEPDVTPYDMIARAQALRSRLRDEQAAAEERGTYSREMHEAFKQAGFYRLMQPRRFGGYEFDVPAFFRIIMEVARGCPGTGWCLGLAAGHHMMVSFFPEQTQASAYGATGHFAAPFRPVPMGTARRISGGWQINGEWDYCSGAPYSTHAILGIRFDDDDAPFPTGQVILAREQWTILDNWRGSVLGMTGSGSNSIRVSDAIVDDDSVVFGRLDQIPRGRESRGYLLHQNAMYAGVTEGYASIEVAAILAACARAALDEYERLLREKKTFGPNPQPRFTLPDYQRWYCEAAAKVDAAEELVLRGAERYMECCRAAVSGQDGDWGTGLAEIDLVTHRVTFELAWEAVELMFRTSGSSEGARNGSRMQRYYRDFSMARTNVYVRTGVAERAFTAAKFGLEMVVPF